MSYLRVLGVLNINCQVKYAGTVELHTKKTYCKHVKHKEMQNQWGGGQTYWGQLVVACHQTYTLMTLMCKHMFSYIDSVHLHLWKSISTRFHSNLGSHMHNVSSESLISAFLCLYSFSLMLKVRWCDRIGHCPGWHLGFCTDIRINSINLLIFLKSTSILLQR